MLKILALDIETAPNTAHVWGLWNQNIGINQLLDTGRVMCFAWKWINERDVSFISEHNVTHKAVIKKAWELTSDADAILTYNGAKFDMPTLNKEFVKQGYKPPAPYKHIDLLRVARKHFRFASNKMDHLAKELGLPVKHKHAGHDMWISCMAGDHAAWQCMEKYNKKDVVILEKLYNRLLAWIDNHPNRSLYIDGYNLKCPNCGSLKLQSRGITTTRTSRYRRFQCQKCGHWSRMRTPEKTTTLTHIVGG